MKASSAFFASLSSTIIASGTFFASLSSTIIDISRYSGIPGVSIGVLDIDGIIHQEAYGFCDVEKQVPCDQDSTFVLGSLTKSFTTLLLAQLVEYGDLKWDDPLHQILPEFQRDKDSLSRHATIADLLSHRSGLSAFDALWVGSNNKPLLNHSESVKILSYLPQQDNFRDSFIYNNFAFEVLGHVIERISGTSYASFLQKSVVEPLGLKRTYYTNAAGKFDNEAKPYAALKNGSTIRIAPALSGDDVLMGPAGGVRSCVSDLLTYAGALLDAAATHMDINATPPSTAGDSPRALAQISAMWTGWNVFPMPFIRESSYGYGWLRAELPSVLAPTRGDERFSPLVGLGARSRLAVWHSGDIPGYQSFITLFPETRQATVVLMNAISLGSGSRYINDLVINALLGSLEEAPDYVELAKLSAEAEATRMDFIYEDLLNGRTRDKPSNRLISYVGTYFNSAGNFFIEVSASDEEELSVAFMGRSTDKFRLRTYGDNSFFWFLSHDETARLARYQGYADEFYILRFGSTSDDHGSIDTLWWKHDPSLDGFGEAFKLGGSQPYNVLQNMFPDL